MNRRRIRFVLLGCDLIWIIVALAVAVGTRYLRGHLLPGELHSFVPVLIGSLVTWPVFFAWLKLDGFRWGAGLAAVAANSLLGVVGLLGVTSAVSFLLRPPAPRGAIAGFILLLLLGFNAIRRIVLAWIKSGHRLVDSRKVLIVGNGTLAHEVHDQIRRHPEFFYEVVGYLHSDIATDSAPAGTADVDVSTGGLRRLLQENDIGEVFVVERRLPALEMSRLFELCNELEIGLSFIPQTYEMYVFSPEMLDLAGLPFVRLRPVALSLASRVSKRFMDLVIGTLCLLVFLPIMAVLAVYSWLATGKPMSCVPRAGRQGAVFHMWRFPVASGPVSGAFAAACHRRSLTELPQLLNVLRGEMSLVGPRPESPERARHYSDWQRLRLRVAPGITGLAQVQGIRAESSSEAKTKFDLQYIQSWSPGLDISLLLQTIATLLSRGSSLELKATSTSKISEVSRSC